MISILILSALFQFKSVTLAWDPSPQTQPCTILGYNIYRAITSNGYNVPLNLNEGLITDTMYTDAQAPTTSTVFYVVRAMCDSVESPNSNEVSINTAQQITGLSSICYTFPMSPPTSGQPFGYISWNAIPGAVNYTVSYQDITQQPGQPLVTVTTIPAQYQFNTIIGHTYQWEVMTTINGVSTAPAKSQFTCANIAPPKLRIQ